MYKRYTIDFIDTTDCITYIVSAFTQVTSLTNEVINCTKLKL